MEALKILEGKPSLNWEYDEEADVLYPPTQKTPAVKPGMNALDGPSEALPSSLPAGRQGQSEGGFSLLRRIPPKGLRYHGR